MGAPEPWREVCATASSTYDHRWLFYERLETTQQLWWRNLVKALVAVCLFMMLFLPPSVAII